MSQQLILTTGIYDLIKEQVRRRKVSFAEGELLLNELKNARQVRRRDLPQDVVSVNTKVRLKNHLTGFHEVHNFVPPGKAKLKKQTKSITSPIGLALVGYAPGAKIKWPFDGRETELEILEVEQLTA